MTRINFILDNIPDDKQKILDVGCWEGTYSQMYKKRTNTVYAIEGSKSAAERAAEKGIIVECGNFVENDFFPNMLFDVIVAGEIIEHVFDPDMFIEKVRRMLAHQGKLIITTPNVVSLPRRVLMLFGKNPSLENRVSKESAGHIRYFTFEEMERLLQDHGFEIIRSVSDVVNFNGAGTLYSTLIPRLFKRWGRSIMIIARKVS
jgi:2-polyprenyl-3-methyl-5-hydroxy-6-metoxy-1,4-benzoquinol methylase